MHRADVVLQRHRRRTDVRTLAQCPQRSVATDVRQPINMVAEHRGPGGRNLLPLPKRDKAILKNCHWQTKMSVLSADDPATGAPIGWGALSGLVADPAAVDTLYGVSDSYYGTSRIYTIDASATPARITSFVELQKDGQPVAYDPEGIALKSDGGFWWPPRKPDSKTRSRLAACSWPWRPTARCRKRSPCRRALWRGRAVRLRGRGRLGRGCNAEGDRCGPARVAGRPGGHDQARDLRSRRKELGLVHYPLDAPVGPGWVGLSEITALGDDRFALIERDNQPGDAAALKKVTVISLAGVEPKAYGETLPVVAKRDAIDLLPLMRATHGWISDKPEGLAVLANGELVAVTDNDGVDDATGETLFLRLGSVPPPS